MIIIGDVTFIRNKNRQDQTYDENQWRNIDELSRIASTEHTQCGKAI